MNERIIKSNILELIRSTVWERTFPFPFIDKQTYEDLRIHALICLPAKHFASLKMPDDLRQEWRLELYQRISYNVNYLHAEANLPITVPYVILKGSSAAQYYPNPLYRDMGDIDIMPRKEDYALACEELLHNGYNEITDNQKDTGRHRQFIKDGIEVEVHAYYAYMKDPERAKLIDDLIKDSINISHVLPDDINGLVLLDHINHHMETGIGLRQIIDWMMYVHKCLPDEKWPSFQKMVRQTGHEQLGMITTRMCELYLGLPEHHFCAEVDSTICGEFMDYVLSNGNFGRKQDVSRITSQSFFANAHSLKSAFLFLQGRGMITWSAAQRHSVLRSFAWIYQGFRYLKKGIGRNNALAKLKEEFQIGKKRNDLFDALGVTREGNGRINYREREKTNALAPDIGSIEGDNAGTVKERQVHYK